NGRDKQADTALRDLVLLERQMVAEVADVDNRTSLAHSLTNLSIQSRKQGKLKEADELVRESLALYEGLAAERPFPFSIQYGLARTRSSLGTVLAATGRPVEAEQAYRDALKSQKQLAARYPDRIPARQDLGNTYAMLGKLLQTRRPEEAEAAHREAITVRRQLVAAFPGAPALRENLAINQIELAYVLTRLGRHGEAV